MEKRRRKIEKLKEQLNIETNMHLKISEEEQLRREKLEEQCIFYDKNYEEQYLELNILGEGCVGQVKKVQKISNNKYFASKMVHTNDEEKVNQIIEEFLNCKKLEHPNIVKVYELHIDTNNEKIYTIMEYIAAKQMFSVIHRIKSFNENIASNIFKQILLGIKYMHEQGVCHRDLKPNNILVNEDGLCVKITDFNISKFGENKKKTLFDQQDTVKMWTYTGTVAFTAPEVFDGQYNQGVDLWSAGVVLYCMLSGVQPFESEYVKDLIYKIQNDEVKLAGPVWDNISKDAKQLISLLLQKNPKNRPTINKALLHPFITKKQNSSPLTDLAFQNMKSNLQKLLTKYGAFQELVKIIY
ncbi:Protein kinase-like domain [Pseudocohnilembus persalinus]|uniref:Protein kinase-like domain n=1 Tax=Pseudocohnilembus persalinus TaxID=266149 RepID=A0A0V0QPD1_PSEPJ|nr:Protein kinase-like domain [Pseudocohnilembus persalinus]|eukprot:KRX03946.1 Protein kinase-like domain [Pseudocohnilembus persalinus]